MGNLILDIATVVAESSVARELNKSVDSYINAGIELNDNLVLYSKQLNQIVDIARRAGDIQGVRRESVDNLIGEMSKSNAKFADKLLDAYAKWMGAYPYVLESAERLESIGYAGTRNRVASVYGGVGNNVPLNLREKATVMMQAFDPSKSGLSGMGIPPVAILVAKVLALVVVAVAAVMIVKEFGSVDKSNIEAHDRNLNEARRLTEAAIAERDAAVAAEKRGDIAEATTHRQNADDLQRQATYRVENPPPLAEEVGIFANIRKILPWAVIGGLAIMVVPQVLPKIMGRKD